jgi:uncharacterized protein YcbK (DUF882 family)
LIESTRIFGGWRTCAFASRKTFAGLFLSIALLFVAASAASAETRTLKLYFIHTKERAEITYKRNGRYIGSGLDQINRFLRDWRRNEPTKMDPRLLDLVWEVYQATGARDYINVVSAYRSPSTNSMLRSRSKGVAKNSQHTLGKAMDFFIPGVNLATLRKTALKVQRGGVGYYPRSGSPFVHLDVGSVRHWPRMNRNELLALFPDGRTAHIPSDGKPLAGYSQALAAIKSGKQSSAPIQVASADDNNGRPRRGLLSILFGGADEAEDNAESVERVAPRQPVVASAAPAPAPVEPETTPETILASLSPTAIPFPQSAPRVSADSGSQALALTEPDNARDTAQEALDAAAAVLAQTDEAQPIEVALNIPVPTRRPEYTPVVDDEGPVQMADAAAPGGLPVPVGASATQLDTAAADKASGPSATVAAYLPLPKRLPGDESSPEYVLASLPDAGPSYSAPPISSESGEVVVSRPERSENTNGRSARLGSAPAASQRAALISGDAQGPEEAIATGVKTTAKAAKPGPGDSRPDPRTVLVPIPRQVAQWALNPAPATMEKRGTRAPSFELAHVRLAPQMVYTAGFGRDTGQHQANRFTGKAVTFLSVARFKTIN